MGQAKLRGTKEEREALAIAEREAIERIEQERVAEQWRKLTPKQKQARLDLASFEVMALGTLLRRR